MPINSTSGRHASDRSGTQPGLSAMMEQIIRNAHSVSHILPALEIASYRAGRA